MPTATITDNRDLVLQLKQRTHESFAELYERFSAVLFGIICKIVGDKTTAKDVLQDVFVKVWKNIENYDENENKQVEAFAKKYPEIKNEIVAFQKVLRQYALEFSLNPSLPLKTKTLNIIDNLINEQKCTQEDLPILNKYSDHNNWLRIVKPLLPKNLNEQICIKVLRDDNTLFQTIIWTKLDYPEEVHNDLKESFIILERECECYLGNEIIKLGPGGFLDIPLHVHHDVKIIKGPVLAVVQRLKVA